MDKINFKIEKLKETIKTPTFTVENNDEFVQNGEDNRLDFHLLDLYDNVALNRAIIDKKTNLLCGDGVTFDALEDDKQSINTQEFINEVNPFESMDDLLSKIGVDWFMFGGSYLAIKWNRTGTKILEIYHLPYYKVRVGIANEYGFIDKFYYRPTDDITEQWMNGDMIEPTDKVYPAFSTKRNKGKTQVLFIKKYNVRTPYYPLPDYFGARRQLDTAKRIAAFWNDSIANGLVPSHSIFAFGQMSKEEREQFVKDLKSKYSPDNGGTGKPLVGVFSNKDQRIEIEAIEASNLDKMYIQLNQDTTVAIATAHQYPLALAITQPGKLGNTSDVVNQMELFINTYIIPNQNKILDFINKIMVINGLKEISIINKSLKTPITLNNVDASMYLTKDEIRAELGYQPLENDIVEEDVNVEDNNNVENTNTNTNE